MKTQVCSIPDQSVSSRKTQKAAASDVPAVTFTVVGDEDMNTERDLHNPRTEVSKAIQSLTDQWLAQLHAGTAHDLAHSLSSLLTEKGPRGYSAMQRVRTAGRREQLNTSGLKPGKRQVHSTITSPSKVRTPARTSPNPRSPNPAAIDIQRICLSSLVKSALPFTSAVHPLVRTASDPDLSGLYHRLQCSIDFSVQVLEGLNEESAVATQVAERVFERLATALTAERDRTDTLLASLKSAHRSAVDTARTQQVCTVLVENATSLLQAKLRAVEYRLHSASEKLAVSTQTIAKIAYKRQRLADERLLAAGKEIQRLKVYEALYYRAQNTVFKLQKEVMQAKRERTEGNSLESDIARLKAETVSVGAMLEQRCGSERVIEGLRMRAEDLEARLAGNISVEQPLPPMPPPAESSATIEQYQMAVEDCLSALQRYQTKQEVVIRRLQEQVDDLEAENSVLGSENSFLNKECEDMRAENPSFCEFGKAINRREKVAESPIPWGEEFALGRPELEASGRSPASGSLGETGKLRQLVADLQRATATLQTRLQERDPAYIPADCESSLPARYQRLKRTCHTLKKALREVAARAEAIKGRELEAEAVKQLVHVIAEVWKSTQAVSDSSASVEAEWAKLVIESPDSARRPSHDPSVPLTLTHFSSDAFLCTLSESGILQEDSPSPLLIVTEVRVGDRVWKLVKNAGDAFQWLPQSETNVIESVNSECQQLRTQLAKAAERLKLLRDIEALAGTQLKDPNELLPWLQAVLSREDSGEWQSSPPISTCAQSLKVASEPISRRSFDYESRPVMDVKTLCEELASSSAAKDFSSAMGPLLMLKEAVILLTRAVQGKENEAVAAALRTYFGESSGKKEVVM